MPTIRETRILHLLPPDAERRRRRLAWVCVAVTTACVITFVVLMLVGNLALNLWTPKNPLEFIACFMTIAAIWATQVAIFLFRDTNDSALVRSLQDSPFVLGSEPTLHRKSYGPGCAFMYSFVTIASIVYFIRYISLLL